MLQLISLFQNADYQITFASSSIKSEHAFDLSSLGIDMVEIILNDSSLDVFVKKLNPEIVLFDRFMTEEQFGWRVAEQCPEALRILDTEDLHSLRKGRGLALNDGKPFDTSYLYNDTAKREIASIYRCDLSLIISEAEMALLLNTFNVPQDLIYYLPFLLDPITALEMNELPAFKDRQHFMTIGNFLHEPNYDAIVYLKKEIWPKIRIEVPNAELHIYGSYESQKVTQLHNANEGFLIKGFVPQVSTAMREARVCLAPLRFGAGLKGKLFDAMKNGTPCVMSSIAAEGVFGDLQPNGFIEDTIETFVKQAITLYNDESVWNTKQTNGINILNQRFQKLNFEAGFKATIEKMVSQLKTYRLNNFTGQMLMHHKLKSTKFMSKWIEEKNKRKSETHAPNHTNFYN